MKKLMIAAAAAAMIGGAEAAWNYATYTFHADLTTTTGFTVLNQAAAAATVWNLGQNGDWRTGAAYWYNDATAGRNGLAYNVGGGQKSKVDRSNAPQYAWADNENDLDANGNPQSTFAKVYPHLVWTTHLLDDGRYAPALEIRNATKLQDLDQREIDLLNGLADRYTTEPWCCTISIFGRNDLCYRIAGSNFLEEKLYLKNDCCDAVANRVLKIIKTDGDPTLAEGTLVGGKMAAWQTGIDAITFGILNRFGALTEDDATSLEAYGTVGTFAAGAPAPTSSVETKGYFHHLYFWGNFAGQGSWIWGGINRTPQDARIPQSLTGGIVGYTEPSLCDVCCDIPVYTGAFDCLYQFAGGVRNVVTPMIGNYQAGNQPAGAPAALNTAAWGTFYITLDQGWTADDLYGIH